MTGLADRVVAVIGGANGIGRETARRLALAGARVAIGDRDGAAALRAAEALEGTAIGLAVDVTSTASLESFLTAVDSALGPVETLVNSAGVMWVGPFDAEPEPAARAQIDVNLLGAINAVKATAPRMLRRRAGHIVVIASAASLLPTPGEATYAASKHGVLGYLKAVRAELRGSGVEISVIMPTVVETALAAGTSPGAAKMLQPADVARAVLTTIMRPRFEVTIPAYLGPVRRAIDILPAAMRDALLRRLVPDQVRASDRKARQDYEATFLDRA
ncbi:SDR family oxidoreductase [Agromyces laixinhei]|uniref:SDR family oxidoreductase n=1 Tax=Agromyces laixinhei TaxID=2585717 RepID=UPI0012ED75DC|nr:SDR family oxidoreductase [Agromyces laixinhei]